MGGGGGAGGGEAGADKQDEQKEMSPWSQPVQKMKGGVQYEQPNFERLHTLSSSILLQIYKATQTKNTPPPPPPSAKKTEFTMIFWKF